MHRRNFISQSVGLLSLTSLFSMTSCFRELKKMQGIGIQLFSLPKSLDTDFVKSIKMLQQMGYTQLELFGPYPFSVPAVWEEWKAITPMLGFNGSGYFGRDIKEIKLILEDHGMTAPSAHTDIGTLKERMGALAAAAHVLGHEYVTLPAIPPEMRTSLGDYRRIATVFNEIGEAAKEKGIKFAYHNHGYGIKPLEDGTVPLEVLIESTDPELVFLEMDVFWTAAGGVDPVSYLKKYPNRYHMLHLKDMKPRQEFSGDGGNPQEWFALFPNMTTAGAGELGLEEIVKTGLETGVKHFFVEQDLVANPEVALKESFDFLELVS